MTNTLTVSKNGKEQTFIAEYLQNNDVLITKNAKGENFEITLHRFSNDEIDEFKNVVESIYNKDDKPKNSIKAIVENLFK